MVRERIVVDTIVDLRIRVSGAFGAKLPDCPVFTMLVVEEFDERVERISVSALGVRATGA